jgi:hypothetical protein
MKLGTPLVLATACATVLSVAGPAAAAGPAPRTLVSGHVSISAVQGGLPVGATISVLQYCPAGSRLDKAATRTTEAQVDTLLDRHVRLASREFWPAGTVSRYRVVRRVPAGGAVPLLNAALCVSTAPAGAKTVSGRAATDLRVWGPAASRLGLVNATVAVVTDDPDADHVFATAMAAAGVASSQGSLRGAVRAVQEVTQEEGLSAVAAVGTTSRRVTRGRFVSMRNTYSYVSDLTRKITGLESRV